MKKIFTKIYFWYLGRKYSKDIYYLIDYFFNEGPIGTDIKVIDSRYAICAKHNWTFRHYDLIHSLCLYFGYITRSNQ